MNMNDRFGVCPECFNEGKLDEEYHYVNVGRVHFMICERHKTGWYVGSNLFSAWRYENWKLWEIDWSTRITMSPWRTWA